MIYSYDENQIDISYNTFSNNKQNILLTEFSNNTPLSQMIFSNTVDTDDNHVVTDSILYYYFDNNISNQTNLNDSVLNKI